MNAPAPRKILNPGKLAVVGILLLAVGLAGFAWWWNWQRTVKCREFYGGEGAHLIRTATQIDGLELSEHLSGAEPSEELKIGADLFSVASRKDLSKAHGLIHARTALLDDGSYRWDDQTTGDCQPKLLYAVRFREGERQVTLVFDFGCPDVWIVETQRQATLAPKIAEGWQSFLQRQMASEPVKSP
jgi:hypothetical protein